MKSNIFFFGMFFIMISCRITMNIFPFYDLGYLSTLFVGMEYICILMAIILTLNSTSVGVNKYNKLLFYIFVIYTLYTWEYNFVSPQMPSDFIQSMPENKFAMVLSTFAIGSSLLLAQRANRNLNHLLFAKISLVVIVLTLIFYFLEVDYTYYAISRAMRADDALAFNEDNRMFDPLSLNGYVAVAYVCNLVCKNIWSRRKLINITIFIIVAVYLAFVALVIGERGPVLFMITTTMFYYFAKEKFAGKYFAGLTLIVLLILIFSEQILDTIYSFAPDIVDRTINIVADGGSGRFGSDDSVYAAAIQQIKDNPFLGSYHRLLTSSWRGCYPHNIILESLMTFGIVFSIPLFWLMWKAVKNAFWAIRNGDEIGFFGLLFVHVCSCMLTSGTMFLHYAFWVSLAMALTYQNTQNNKQRLVTKHQLKYLAH